MEDIKTLRKSEVKRETKETGISIALNIDGGGNSEISTEVGFFDHMLTLFSKHGLFDLNVKAKGDIHVDCHHLVEDTGIVLGMCIKEALSDKVGIKRYGTRFVPMDEALVMTSLDISGRPYLVFDCPFNSEKIGDYDTQMTREFLQALAINAGITIHVKQFSGINDHHITEAVFKSLGGALRDACERDKRISGVLSTKGIL